MRIVLVVVCALAAASASAQRSRDLAREQRAAQAAQELADAEAAGAAAAVRPGDEDLSCEALQTEMVAIAQSPAMQNFAQGFGAQAQADFDKLNEAQAAAEEQTKSARKGILRGMVLGAATAVTPGADKVAARAQQAASMAQSAQRQAEANRNVDALLGQSGNVAAMAGPAMRGQRLIELAEARDCAWLKDGGAGALPPGALPPQPGSAPGALPPGLSLPPQPGSAPPP
jgi:hypothetical protein